MSSTKRIIAAIATAVIQALTSRTSRPAPQRPGRSDATLRTDRSDAAVRSDRSDDRLEPGQVRGSETIRVDPDGVPDLRVDYAPSRDGAPDAGEVVWTWVPYEENDGRGKDRPVLIIGRQSAERAYAVRMTSRAHDGDRDFLPIGSGAWDSKGRESWVDIEQLYSVHEDGMRREAAILDRPRYDRVAAALIRRYGWSIGR